MAIPETLAAAIVEAMREGLMITAGESGDARIVFLNESARKHLELESAAVPGLQARDLYAGCNNPRTVRSLDRVFTERKPFTGEVRLGLSDGEARPCEMRVSWPDGAHGCITFQPVEEKRKLHDTLLEEQGRLVTILRQVSDGVLIADAENRVQGLNRVAEQITGWRLAEARNESVDLVFRLVDAETREPLASPVKRILKSGLKTGLNRSCHLLNHRGETTPISFLAAPIENRHRTITGVIVVFQDESLREQLTKEQIRSEKMETVGLLAGGVGHDMNNLLTAIMGNISLAIARAGTGQATECVRDPLKSAENATNRARALSRQLLSLARGNAPVTGPVNAKRLIEETARFSLSGSNLALEIGIEDGLRSCLIDETKLSQVLNNLLVNAKQAMPGGGTVRISAENVEIGDEPGLPLSPGIYLHLEVEDTGCGVDPAYLSRIFDPYFTTKSEGTGLGLANCRAIIKQAHGHILARSEPGAGTMFEIYIPASAEETEPAVEETAPVVYKGEGRILVMDDETLIRQIAGDILEHLGYQPDFAEDGREAIRKLQALTRESEPYAAILVDLAVPGGMGGLETQKQVEELAPDIPVIVSSGYSNDPVLVHFKEHGFAGVALKPYNIQELSWVLNRAIHGDDGSPPPFPVPGHTGTPFPFRPNRP